MGTRRFVASAATIGSVLFFALSSGATALAAPGDGASDVAAASVICDPGFGKITYDEGTGAPIAISCMITQAGPGNNEARCIEQSSAPAMVETCMIEQTNTTGNNHAVVVQEIRQKNGAVQTGQQRVTITQTNASGLNDAGTDQTLSQSTDAAGNQTQTSDQGFRPGTGEPGVTILQTNADGANMIHLNQAGKQKEKTGDSTALQSQTVGQSSHLDQHTAGATHATIHQDVDQNQDGPNKDNQSQIADPHCCNFFDGSQVNVDLHQDVSQKAMMGAAQFADNTAHCVVTPATAGNCKVRETINQNGAKITNTCSSPMCATGQECISGACVPCPTVTVGGEGDVVQTLPNCPPPCPDCGISLSNARQALETAQLNPSTRPAHLSTA